MSLHFRYRSTHDANLLISPQIVNDSLIGFLDAPWLTGIDQCRESRLYHACESLQGNPFL